MFPQALLCMDEKGNDLAIFCFFSKNPRFFKLFIMRYLQKFVVF